MRMGSIFGEMFYVIYCLHCRYVINKIILIFEFLKNIHKLKAIYCCINYNKN